MDLKKQLWDKLTQLEEKKQGKADTYYDILALFNVVVPNGALCDNLDANKNCKNMCLTRCVDGHEF